MSERERVKSAIEGPVEEATKILDQSAGADVETRLSILINGWGRGIAAGLEELAIAVSDLRRGREALEPEPAAREPHADAAAADQPEGDARAADEPRRAAEDMDELRHEAAQSREATKALRDEASRDQ